MPPRKRNLDSSYGQKLVQLFARLLFSGDWLGLTDLARDLGCSKQTVMRLVDDITLSYKIDLQSELRGGRRWYRIPRRVPAEPAAMLTPQEMDALLMCRAFARHLLGGDGFVEAERALEKTSQLLTVGGDGDGLGQARFGVFRPGSIDYTPHMETLQTISRAIADREVLEAEYRKPGFDEGKLFRFKPLKVFSWRESIYVHARYAAVPGEAWKDPGYDPILALQRFRWVKPTGVTFRWPRDYDFDRDLNRQFGLMRGDRFRVVAEFTGWAADYVAERQWSPGQVTTWQPDGSLRLEFEAVSSTEMVGWVAGFGACCEIKEPAWLVDEVRAGLEAILSRYERRAAG